MNNPDCYNRPDRLNSYEGPNGYHTIEIESTDGFLWDVTVQNFVDIPNRMSKDCTLNEEFGAATMYKWNCKGCKHFKGDFKNKEIKVEVEKIYNCGVLNCGNGNCVHELLDKKCPDCGEKLVMVKHTGFIFCSSDQVCCDYEIWPKEKEKK